MLRGALLLALLAFGTSCRNEAGKVPTAEPPGGAAPASRSSASATSAAHSTDADQTPADADAASPAGNPKPLDTTTGSAEQEPGHPAEPAESPAKAHEPSDEASGEQANVPSADAAAPGSKEDAAKAGAGSLGEECGSYSSAAPEEDDKGTTAAAFSAEYPLQENPLAGCTLCHVDIEDQFLGSIHFEEKVGCRTCHGPSEGHVADENNEVKPDEMFARRDVDRLCGRCHECPRPVPAKPELTADGQAKVCTDCHGPHDVALADKPNSAGAP